MKVITSPTSLEAAAPLKDQEKPCFTWLDALLAAIAGVLAMFIYARTAVPGLLTGDGGEFQTLTYLLGSTHPTGYPVYIMLSRLFTLLPLGDLAYRVNLFSGFMGALAVSGVYLCGHLLSRRRAVAMVGALALAISPTFWSQALIAEVYTAGAAFFVFIILALLYWDLTGKRWALFSAGLLGGLSLGVHMSVALLAPAVLLFLLLHWRQGWPMWKTAVAGALSGAGLFLLLGLLLYWNDPTAGYYNSVIKPSHSAWGFTADQIDGPLEQILFGLEGSQFQQLMFANINEVMLRQAGDYRDNLGSEYAPLLLAAAAAGILALLARWPRVAVLLVAALAIQLIFFFNYEIIDLYVFYIPSYVLLVLLAIAGLGGAIDLVGLLAERVFGDAHYVRPALDLLLAGAVIVFALWPIFQPRQGGVAAGAVPFDYEAYPQYNPRLTALATAVVAELPPNAVLFTNWDMMWPYYYAAHLQGDRQDLMFVETYPAVNQTVLAGSLVEYVLENFEERPLLFDYRNKEIDRLDNVRLSLVQIGPKRFVQVVRK